MSNTPCARCGKQNPAEIHTCTPLALRLADALLEPVVLDKHAMQAAAELRRLHAENEGRAARIAALYEQIEREEALMSNLLLNLEREKASRQAAQIENEDLKARIARSGVEQQRAVLAERDACANVCDARYMGDNNREDMEARRCAEAIRARGAAPQQEGEIS